MKPYIIEGDGDSRVLIVMAASAHRYRFNQIIGKELVPVKLKRAGSKLVAVVSKYVLVYKMPNAMQYHKELMQHNARAQWCGLAADFDRLLDNMMEYEETI